MPANQVFITNGCGQGSTGKHHTDRKRVEQDYYATHPKALELLLPWEKFSSTVIEPACGEGHLVKVLEANGYNVQASDLYHRADYEGGVNFLSDNRFNIIDADLITNPPFNMAEQFVLRALESAVNGVKICMFLKLTFLEGKARRSLFEKYPPKRIYVSSKRLSCAPNGDFSEKLCAMAFTWFIWEKGFKGDPVVKWFN